MSSSNIDDLTKDIENFEANVEEYNKFKQDFEDRMNRKIDEWIRDIMKKCGGKTVEVNMLMPCPVCNSHSCNATVIGMRPPGVAHNGMTDEYKYPTQFEIVRHHDQARYEIPIMRIKRFV